MKMDVDPFHANNTTNIQCIQDYLRNTQKTKHVIVVFVEVC